MAHLSDDETVAKMGHPALCNGLNRVVEKGPDVSVVRAVSRSFDYGGKNAAFAQDDRVWGRWKERRIAYAMAHLSDDETVAKMGHAGFVQWLESYG